jgi:uncharacterized protein YjbJ (UPF0337 family)
MDGTTDDIKGRLKEAAGDLTDNDDLKAEGKTDRASGKAKDVVEKVKDKADDAIDKVKDALNRDD